MPAIVELYYWHKQSTIKSDYPHVGVKISGREGPDIYAAYSTQGREINGRVIAKWPWTKKPTGFDLILDEEVDKTDKMGYPNTEDQHGRNLPREPDEKIHIEGLDTKTMTEWFEEFRDNNFLVEHKVGRYKLCNLGLILYRILCINVSNAPEDDKEAAYIKSSGNANCAVFAYAMLRKGGLQPPDGISPRHFVFSTLLALCGSIQLIYWYGVWGLSTSTPSEITSVTKSALLFLLPVITTIGAIITTTLNACRGTLSVRTPEALVNLVKIQQNGPLFNTTRQILGPNNCLTWVLYSGLLTAVALDTLFMNATTDLAFRDSSTMVFGIIEGTAFLVILICDWIFESKRCALPLRNRWYVPPFFYRHSAVVAPENDAGALYDAIEEAKRDGDYGALEDTEGKLGEAPYL